MVNENVSEPSLPNKISSDEPSFVFSVSGWARQDPTRLVIKSRADIDLARSIIAAEVRGLKQRLKPLKKRLKPGTAAYDKVAASKVRPQFDIQAKQLHSVVPEKPSYFAPHFFAPEVAREVERHGMTALVWLPLRFPNLGPVLCVSNNAEEFALSRAAQERGFLVLNRSAGMGDVRVSRSGLADRMRPSEDSFVDWFHATDVKMRASVSCFFLDDDCKTFDAGLLQLRLAPHHVLCVHKGAPALQQLLRRWDGTVYELDDAYIFSDPGPIFLDPLYGGGSHIPDAAWPKISVVTVSYNQADFLEDCLLSVLDQDYPNLEYIVVDAVSNDGSIEILERYRSRIDTLVIEKDNGQSDGLNKGFDRATGDIYTWINSDDMLTPGSLKRAALGFMEHGTDLVAGGCERITEDSDNVTMTHHSALPYLEPTPLGFAQNLIWRNSWEKGDYFFQPEVMFSARIWEQSGGCLKEHLYWAMDWELWIRMAMAGADIVHIPSLIGRSREHPAQKTTGEELYLHQLLNILLETDDALVAVQAVAKGLPAGEKTKWVSIPEPVDGAPRSIIRRIAGLRKPHVLRRAVVGRLKPHQTERLRLLRDRARKVPSRTWGRRGFRAQQMDLALAKLVTAEREREIAVQATEAQRVELSTAQARLRDFEHIQGALVALVAQAEEQNLTLAELKANVSLKEQSLNEATSFVQTLQLHRSQQETGLNQAVMQIAELDLEIERLRGQAALSMRLRDERARQEEGLKQAAKQVAELEAEVARLQKEAAYVHELREERTRQSVGLEEATRYVGELEAELARLKALVDQNDALALSQVALPEPDVDGRSVSERFASFASQLLFGTSADVPTQNIVREGLATDVSLIDIIRRIARAGGDRRSLQIFRDFRHHLRGGVPLPPFAAMQRGRTEFVIVDVGAEPLSFENDVYAPLIDRQDSLLVRFDPFDTTDRPGRIREADRNGIPYRDLTYPTFVGDGMEALFRINRFQPTSSLLEANMKLVEPFGLLKNSLETVETRTVETRRLDDIFKGVRWMPHGIDLLKIDVQGATQSVIENATRVLKKTLIVQLEAEFAQVYKGEQTFASIDTTMRKADFGLLDLRDLGHMPYGVFSNAPDAAFHASRLLWSDVVYVRSLDNLAKLSEDELVRLTVLAHEVYGKYDFAMECLRVLDGKNQGDLAEQYGAAMHPQ